MKRLLFTVSIIFVSLSIFAQWKPAGDKIKSVWGESLDANNVLPEYPRPILERAEWKNLNGLWDLTIKPVNEGAPEGYNKKILVPFPLESSLSGLAERIDEKHAMWYRRTFTIPSSWKSKNIILHFGAADWKTEVFVNDIRIGSHTGGYTPFRFDITPFLTKDKQTLTVKVWDPTDKYFQPRGKQVSEPAPIVYTPVSGIWQTVWIEPVSRQHIVDLKTLPDVDKSTVAITVNTKNTSPKDYAEIKIFDGSKTVSTTRSIISEKITIQVADAKLWTPDSPFLYDMEIKLFCNGKETDRIKSYFAMRKISVRRDKDGIMRIQLNNKNLIHSGLLDQGYWPDGLYTAPSDDALKFDIVKAKEWGYNMLRKHIKTEPARWYTWCDRLGMLVWQDMPSGDNNWREPDTERSPFVDSSLESKPNPAHDNFFKEWKEIIDCLYNYPSIVIWIPFNEGWGQFRTNEVAEFTRKCDPSRLLNVASGWHHSHEGDIIDDHNYPEPKLMHFDANRPAVIGEYGGISVVDEEHLWNKDNNFGYIEFKTPKEATDKYIEYSEMIKNLIKKGVSGTVYTQITDVEDEASGIMTYDRKSVKLDEERLHKINSEICRMLE
ncbi:MAG: beta-galactosidase [Dysgonamonadaceae bacterium]|jgi:beta-galactosidase/beta-glucuronidase|nr:beta-galactosidase [Dysgonamonadaceae bacterium]